MTENKQWPDPGDFWFRRFLETELPGLAGDALSPLEKAHALRGWACRNTPRAPLNKDMHLSDDEEFGFYGNGAGDLYKAFGDYAGGEMCHGIAYALLKVYELFDFPSFIYNMGFEDSHITHAIVVVTVDGADGPVAVIEDPYYNLTITKDGGAPVDFFEMLDRLVKRRHDGLTIDFDEDGEHDYIAPADITPEERARTGDLNKGTREIGNGRIVFRRFISLTRWVKRQGVEAALEERGFPGDALYLFCLPQGVHAHGGAKTEGAKALMTRINEALEAGPLLAHAPGTTTG